MAKQESNIMTRVTSPASASPLPPEPAELTPEQENQILKEKLREAEAKLLRSGIVGDIEADVVWRMQQGLSREQAIECARRQALYDKALKDAKAVGDPSKDGAAKEILDAGVRAALRTV